MKRAMLGVAALAALAVTSVAVATLRSGDVAQVSATLSATTAANVQTRTFTCDNQTIEITTGRWTGTASSATADLNGPVELHLKSVYNVTRKLGWIDGRLKLRAADDRTSAYLTGVNVDGKVDGWLRGSAGHRDGVLFGSLAGSFSKTGGFTAGTIGSGTGANAAVIAKHTSCKVEKPVRPSVHLVVRGSVEAVSATSLTVKPSDGTANQTCAVRDADDVRRLETGDRVEMTCVQVAGAWTLTSVRKR
jgi:outer membrane lipoprotein SlyB